MRGRTGGMPALFWSAVTPAPSSSFIPVRPFRNCKTPKIVNKLENLQKAKL
jgi:hypothetical protein